MDLYICEKPDQARKLVAVLGAANNKGTHFVGQGWVVVWTIGHVLELCPPESYEPKLVRWDVGLLPVIPKEWQLRPFSSKNRGLVAAKKRQLQAILKLLKSCSTAIVSTDGGREGELIGRQVLEYAGYNGPVRRLWLQSLDSANIRKALAHIRPGAETEALYRAAQARQRLDWLYGLNLTIALTDLFGNRGPQGVLTAGRVQSPTLALVVRRDREIETFRSRPYYGLEAVFAGAEGPFSAQWQPDASLTDSDGRCLQRAPVEAIRSKLPEQAQAIEVNRELKSQSAPLCFSLAELQKEANAKFGLTAKQTLAAAQALYDRGVTTYPRSDNGYLPLSQFCEAPEILQVLGEIDTSLKATLSRCDTSFHSPAWNDLKLEQSDHHAIIPTANPQVRLQQMTGYERQVYGLIRDRYIAQFLGDLEYEWRQIRVKCGEEMFEVTETVTTIPGWQALATSQKDRDFGDLPVVVVGESLQLQDTRVLSKQTKASPRFTEGTLIGAMIEVGRYVEDSQARSQLKRSLGLGTEATRANIIETLLSHQYLKRQGKQLISTERGRQVVQILSDRVTNPVLTATWELELDEIEKGKGSEAAFLEKQLAALRAILADLLARKQAEPALRLAGTAATVADFRCIVCGSEMVLRQSGRRSFWGCAGYPDCTNTLSCTTPSKAKTQKPMSPKGSNVKKSSSSTTRSRRRRRSKQRILKP